MSVRLIDNDEDGTIDIHINGDFLAGWAHFEIPPEIKGRIQAMMTKCFDAGRSARNKELEDFFRRGNAL